MSKKSIFAALFGGTKHDKDMKRLSPIVTRVNEEENWAKSLSDEQVRSQTATWKEMVAKGESTLDELLPKAFAMAREVSFRVLGQRHYDVQVMGAIVLHQGSILEMKTGEGKTLTCVLAAYLNALAGKGVHIITVNDYLAKRDASWMGPVYNALGLSVGVITSEQDNAAKKVAYASDITYGTNNEFGFDYLRDNMKWSYRDKIQPKHAYAIVDEIDSILIDEARTPLIISGQAEDDSEQVYNAAAIAPFLKECEKDPATGTYYELSKFEMLDKETASAFDEKGDYKIDEKSKRVTFTKQGLAHIEELLKNNHVLKPGVDEDGNTVYSIYTDENFEYVHYVTQAVKAIRLFTKDVDYIVKDGEIQIVDEFTGRVLFGRRYSEGLHEAIEAKERVKIKGNNKTFATITFQNFFKMYDKLSGMTGTADTEASEFKQIYNLDVVVVPTNRPCIRHDLPDLMYYNEAFKFQAIINDIKRIHETGQPILVGTASIEKSEILSTLLRRSGIKHEVLNAKNHAREAVIIGEAGSKGAVTIATNMAGRGTDIKLGGSPEHLAYRICGTEASKEEFDKAMEEALPLWKKNYEEVKALGGLYIIGSERHESRRIDNQLRGRSGRQGDPGTSRFYVSMEDNLMRLFAKEGLKEMIGRLGLNTGEAIEHKLLNNAIEKAQLRVEERNFEIRKHLLEYDDVLNEQRNFIYRERDEILESPTLIERIRNNVSLELDDIFEESDSYDSFVENYKSLFTLPPAFTKEEFETENAKENLKAKIFASLKAKEDLVSPEQFNLFIKSIYLREVDKSWVDHLDMLEEIKDSASLQSYAQKNPLVEYKNQASDTFDSMLDEIVTKVTRTIVNVRITLRAPGRERTEQKLEMRHSAGSAITNQVEKNDTTVRRQAPKIGRNDPCPCGSGKKYKNCCGKNL
jgi:preprotein translocase, SecA subunit